MGKNNSIYSVFFMFSDEILFQSKDIKEIINYIHKTEDREYEDYGNYAQRCADNFEAPADFYPSFYTIFKGKRYDITNLFLLERKLEDDS